MLSKLDCPIDFLAATTLKWGGGVKENKDVRDQKILFNKHSVSTLLARECGWQATFSHTNPLSISKI